MSDSNRGSVSHRFQNRATQWSKIATFLPTAFKTIIEGDLMGTLEQGLVRTTGMMSTSGSDRISTICLAVQTQCKSVTDRRTDGRDTRYALHRAVKVGI